MSLAVSPWLLDCDWLNVRVTDADRLGVGACDPDRVCVRERVVLFDAVRDAVRVRELLGVRAEVAETLDDSELEAETDAVVLAEADSLGVTEGVGGAEAVFEVLLEGVDVALGEREYERVGAEDGDPVEDGVWLAEAEGDFEGVSKEDGVPVQDPDATCVGVADRLRVCVVDSEVEDVGVSEDDIDCDELGVPAGDGVAVSLEVGVAKEDGEGARDPVPEVLGDDVSDAVWDGERVVEGVRVAETVAPWLGLGDPDLDELDDAVRVGEGVALVVSLGVTLRVASCDELCVALRDLDAEVV